MTRPEIIRADTIDLQAHARDNPSAQRHQRPTADGSLAPHQAETLREVAAEAAEEILRSPRGPGSRNGASTDSTISEATTLVADGTNSMSAGTRQDALAIAQNGGLSGQEMDDGDMDGETEVDLDDDMMDKISSSPSIEDGASTSTLPCFSSIKSDGFSHPALLRGSAASSTLSDARSSFPYLECPEYVPMKKGGENVSLIVGRHHHPNGEFELCGTSEGLPDPTEPYENDPAENQTFSPRDYITSKDNDPPGLFSTPPNMNNRTTKKTTSRRWPSWIPSSTFRGRFHDADTSQRQRSQSPKRTNSTVDEGYDDYDEQGLTIPYEADEGDDDDDDDGDLSEHVDPRFVDSGWGGECLQESEDIDFEFVYALHTFVATVEGQANATKGDTMVLLDDSNSYWWLVRVVKDSSIGYLPAEHIETPTERLARLNKHRNIDLAATMLGDQADRPKGNIMAAMKRKKKTVQFAPPTFVDYSEIDYSSEEEDAQAGYPQQQQQQQQQAKQSQQADIDSETEDESAKVEPLKPKLAQKDGKADGRKQEDVERSRSSEELLEARSGDGPKKTSDGTVRDSFFKDDTVETKKITLTPNLLRDDDAPRTSSDSKELKQRISFDKLDKEANLGKDDKRKRDKKEKDKKPSAIRNFFSRNHKRKGDEDDDSLGRRDSQDRDGPEEEEPQPTTPERAPAPQRQPSKLQKQMPRTEPSPTRKPNIAGSREAGGGMDIKSFLTETKVNNVANVPPASMRLVEASPDSSPQNHRRAQNGDVRPQKTKQVMSRMDLDDFDTSDEEEVMMSPEPELQQNTAPVVVQQVRQQQPQQQRPYQNPAPNPAGDMYNHNNVQQQPRAAGPAPQQQQQPQVSPEVSPINTNNPPGLIVDTSSSQEEENPQSPSPRSTPSPTELLNQRDEDGEDADTSGIKDSVATTVSSPRNSWNDSNLRAFFDSGSDIRDLLVVVYDKSNLDPVDVSSHPVAGSLFREQNAKLAEITTQLDNMLGDWLARKQRLRGSV